MPERVAIEKEEYEQYEDLVGSEAESLERDTDIREDVGEDWHATATKDSDSADNDWRYIDDGFEAEIADIFGTEATATDTLHDILMALSSWRISLDNNYVLDDLLTQNDDVPTATAYGDMIRLIDEYEKKETGWLAKDKNVVRSLKHLKGAVTRLNESMMKTAAECYADIDEKTTYRDLTVIALDPVGYKLRRVIKKQNKRVMERLQSYDDEIRGEKSMDRVLALFVPEGGGDTWTAEEKSRCDTFINDYATKDAEKRKPHLRVLTERMLDLASSIEMLDREYMESNLEKMGYFLIQLTYFEDVRNDPVNADFFKKLPEETQKKLDLINKIGTSFTTYDFINNTQGILERDEHNRPGVTDKQRQERMLQYGNTDTIVNNLMYDTKLGVETYKRDRR